MPINIIKIEFGWAFALGLAALVAGCGGSSGGPSCAAVTGTAWTPNVPGVSASNHNPAVTVSSTSESKQVNVLGLTQAAPASQEVSFTVDMMSDLGASGSLSLVAQVTGLPAGLAGSAFPLLVSLNDGTNELIHLARSGAAGDCASGGYYQCSSGVCTPSAGCVIIAPSAYTDRAHWEQHQAPNQTAANAPSVSTFPTCNWGGGVDASITNPSCAFTSTFFPGATSRLRSGANYTAKYVLISDTQPSVSAGQQATLKVTVIKKTSPQTAVGGTFDLNLIIVGHGNIVDSRTGKGAQTLNTLISNIAAFYGQSNSNLKLGTVTPIEFTCEAGGETYGDLKISQLNALFAATGNLAPAPTVGKAVNVFLVGSITDDTSPTDSGFTVLGIDGQIGGPPMIGTATSGVTASSFGTLAQSNANCPAGTAICPVGQQDASFYQLGQVITHEMGHYLGLNHPSEFTGTEHDLLNDSPICTKTQDVSGTSILTINSCLSDGNVYPPTSRTCAVACPSYNATAGLFCPAKLECQFNEMMWWTTRNFQEGTGNGDGNLFTPQGGILMSYSPLVQ